MDIGEYVKAMDVNSGKMVDTQVTDVLRDHPRSYYYVINGELKITNDHPVAVVKNDSLAWVRVKDLKAFRICIRKATSNFFGSFPKNPKKLEVLGEKYSTNDDVNF